MADRNNGVLVPNKKQALNSLKMEVANEVGVDINRGANLTTAEAGKVGGNMVKRLIERAESNL